MKSRSHLLMMVWQENDAHDYLHTLTILSLIHPEEDVWPGKTHPMLLPESSCVYLPSFVDVCLDVCLAKLSFLLFF